MDFTWVKRKDCKVLLQDSTLVYLYLLINSPCISTLAGFLAIFHTLSLK
jgi:hypothetical protein